MPPHVVGLIGFVTVLVLILARVPIAIAMGAVGIAGLAVLQPWSSVGFLLGTVPFEAVYPYGLSVVPLFIVMGVFAAHAGLSRQLYHLVYAFIGHWRGGLAHATIGACALFGAICGSSIATAATMCRVALPEMRRRGYDDRLAAATIAAGGTLGIMIPPSIIFAIYGLLTETSIGRLFVSGILPGILGAALYMGAVRLAASRNPAIAPPGERMPWFQRRRALREVWGVVLLFSTVIGGIYFGLFSPTEGAAVGAIGAVVFAVLRREINKARLDEAIRETAGTVGMIFLILIGAALFNAFIEMSKLPAFIAREIGAAGLSPLAVVLGLMALYVVLGCVMDSLSMILLTVPAIFPATRALGIDPIWLGVLIVTVVEIGMITPPVGMNLFVIQGAGRVPLRTIIAGIWPFVGADLCRLALLIAFPAISTWLPALID
ncbi:MAG: TRAP transporter large permease [Alphaproteobacteria bacterium]|nr:TRAP transporter large permease [Alphaproteobacteria bacterium]